MKKKLIMAISAFVLILTIAVGGTYAAFQADSEEATTRLSTTSLDISVEGDTSQVKFDHLVPGQTIKKELTVNNVKDTPLYTRVMIQKYWLDDKGNKDYNEDSSMIKLHYNTNQWYQEHIDVNDEEITLYYRNVLNAKQTTENFLEGIVISDQYGNIDQGKKFALDIRVEAVQSFNGQDAMMAQWGVLATLNDQGQITGIER